MDNKTARRGKIEPVHLEESRRLREMWDQTKELREADEAGTQAAFGEKYGIGNQAAVGFFLNGKTALSFKAAKGFAKGLRCNIADFSPRLAALTEDVPDIWPFKRVDRERFVSLSAEDRSYVEGQLEAAIRQCEQAAMARRQAQEQQKLNALTSQERAHQGATARTGRRPTAEQQGVKRS